MKDRRFRTALVALVTAVVVTACEGRVADPVGEPSTVDIAEAGVDYQTSTTRLWITFVAGKEGPLKRWGISTNGDTTEELNVRLSDVIGGDDDRYEVTAVDSVGGASLACAGFTVNGGAIGNNTYELRLDSRCLRSQSNGGIALAQSIRFFAYSEAYRSGSDTTAWSSPIPRS